MFSFNLINWVILVYLMVLIVSALAAEKYIKKKKSNALVANPYIYSLSLAVWCTSWTYYGSVGMAANSGLLYLAIYLGAFLSVILFPWILKHLILIKEKYRINSMTDFVTARYDKSQTLGIIAAMFVFIGIIPYIAIQLKTILDSISIISTGIKYDWAIGDLTVHYVVILCIVVTILFGLRKLDSTERHPGLIFILAMESLVKLLAIIAIGVFCTFGLNDGFNSVLDKLPNVVTKNYAFMGQSTLQDFFTWSTYIVLAASSLIFLPRQFQVAVIENYDSKHIKKASWLFPMYLFFIHLFVLPVAITGLSTLPLERADSFILLIPMQHSQAMLSLFVFLGGFSAAIGMIMIETVAVSTIVSNQLILPLLNRLPALSFLTKHTLRLRWGCAVFIIYTAYFFTEYVGAKYPLAIMGLISFAATIQFAPAILAGLYWKKANKAGAFCGIALGMSLWFYTLIVPAFIKGGWINQSLLDLGPFGIAWLRPESLFGMGQFDFLSHSLFWTMLFNLSGLILGSLLFAQSESEEKIVKDFAEIISRQSLMTDPEFNFAGLEENILLAPKVQIFQTAMEQYLTAKDAEEAIAKICSDLNLAGKDSINIYTLSQINDRTEKYLSGLVGSSMAFHTLERAHVFNEAEKKELGEVYGRLLAMMKVDPRGLGKKLSELQRRQGQLEEDARILELAMMKKTQELEKQRSLAYQASKLASLGEVAAGIAHEINNPLAIINSSAQIMEHMLNKDTFDKEKFRSLTGNIRSTVVRTSRIVHGMRNIARQSDMEKFEKITIAEMLEDSTNLCAERFKSKGVALQVDATERTLKTVIEVNRTTISQALLNFLNNAFDAILTNPEKWVKIKLEIDRGHLIMNIIDSGKGISPEIQEKMFQPFFTTKDVGKGTGLGLSLSVSFIKQHRGSVCIDNRSPNTCFVIMLPLKHGS